MIQTEINEIGQFIPLHYHYQMLNDSFRMDAFHSAISEVVTSKHKVAELGSGTGILSFLAAKKGAHVYSVEFNPSLVEVSRKFIKDNGLAHKVQISQGDAKTWLPPEPVDLVICEMLHSALLREKQLQVVSAFRDAHFLRFGKKPKLLPNATILGVQPVFQVYDFYGYYAPVPLFQSAYHQVENCMPCNDPIAYKIIDYDKAHMETISANEIFNFDTDVKINALRFITKSLLNINYITGKTVDWHNQHLIIPMHRTLEINAGQSLRVSFNYRPGDSIEALNNAIKLEIIENSIVMKSLSLIA
jgi:protein arginine N-methyltransferase 1